mgnify:CR=1 FL=1
MAHPEMIHLGWRTPMAQGVAGALLDHVRKASPAQAGLPLDLGSHRVLVPSQFAARLIREELAKAEPAGVLLPKIETPENFLNWGDRDAGVATKEACLLTWMEVLTGPACDPRQLDELFPENNGPFPGFTAHSAQPFAEKLMQLRDSLGGAEEPLDFLSISKTQLSGDDPLRWAQLHVLEKDYLQRLEDKGLKDHNAVRAKLATDSYLPAEVEHVWLAGLIDPQPLLLKVLKRHLGKVSITVLIGCDRPTAEEGDLFDAWGIPNPVAWKERRVPWPTFDTSVIIARDPSIPVVLAIPEANFALLSVMEENGKPDRADEIRVFELLTFCEMARQPDPWARRSSIAEAATARYVERVRGRSEPDVIASLAETLYAHGLAGARIGFDDLRVGFHLRKDPRCAALGIEELDVCELLEREGVTKFIDSWEQLRSTVAAAAGVDA